MTSVTAEDLIEARRAVLAMAPMSTESLGRIAAIWAEADRVRATRARREAGARAAR